MPFLSAEWKNLLVVNYKVDNPSLLEKYVPKGTELDLFEGECFVSLVAFLFNKNKLFGLIPTLPFYNFEEVNLRFYIKRKVNGETRRAVAFVKEVVPSRIIAWTARTFYNEPYVRLPMEHSFKENSIQYKWGHNKEFEMKARVGSDSKLLVSGSMEHFILEHYWGYTPQKNGSTTEYEVKHPTWNIREVLDTHVSESIRSFYGEDFVGVLSQAEHSSVLADGSGVTVSLPNNFRAKSLTST